MSKRLTTEEFIKRAKEKHGDKYDYSKVKYLNSYTKVCIICPIHGEFWQTPNDHINGKGCKWCGYDNIKKEYFGFGIYDTHDAFLNDYNKKCFTTWRGMIERCYNEKQRQKWMTYSDVFVCGEWKFFSNFKLWFDAHYIEGWALDKDILIKGNKVYSPDTCCFVPQEINNLITKRFKYKGNGIRGIHKRGNTEAYQVSVARKYIGNFYSEIDAFNAFKNEKEKYIKQMANKWKDKLNHRVYEALYNYKIEITD